jgi:hypothetical protein
MRSTLALTVTVLALAWTAPASAMCGGSPSTTGTTASPPATGGGMMCGMGQRAAATDPMAEPSTPSQGQRAAGGCPCCRNMAMMQGGGMRGMMGGGSSGGMGGMQMPSASQPSTPQSPGAGETPQTPRPQ